MSTKLSPGFDLNSVEVFILTAELVPKSKVHCRHHSRPPEASEHTLFIQRIRTVPRAPGGQKPVAVLAIGPECVYDFVNRTPDLVILKLQQENRQAEGQENPEWRFR